MLKKWRDLPRAVPGLRGWGQLQSSLGQHAAFLGQPDKAIRFFDAALEAFGCLSDPADRAKETAQTACYRAIAMIDDPASPPASVRASVEAVVGPLQEAARSFAGGADPAWR